MSAMSPFVLDESSQALAVYYSTVSASASTIGAEVAIEINAKAGLAEESRCSTVMARPASNRKLLEWKRTYPLFAGCLPIKHEGN